VVTLFTSPPALSVVFFLFFCLFLLLLCVWCFIHLLLLPFWRIKMYILLPRGLCRHAVSVRVSVRLFGCLSHSYILSKRINISSNFFHHQVEYPHHSSFFHTKRCGNIPTGTYPPNWAKIAVFDQYLALASTTACWAVKCRQNFDGGKIYSTEGQSLFMAGDGRQRATHQWLLFMTGSLDVTPRQENRI